MKMTYVKKGLKRNLKINRNAPVNSSGHLGGVHGIRVSVKERMSKRVKQAPRKAAKHLIRTALDPYHEEEGNAGVQSILQVKNGADRVKKRYKQVKKMAYTVKRLKVKATAIKSGSRSRPLNAFRKIKGTGSARSTTSFGNVSKLKTLGSKFVPPNKYASLAVKTGIKKSLSSPAAFLKTAAQQLAKKLLAVVVANPKVWLIAAVIGGVFLLLISVTNSMGASTSSAGSFFMTDEDNAKQYKETVDERNASFQEQIEDYKESGYDDVRMEYMNEDGQLQVNWVEIFALVAVKFEQELTFSDSQNAYIDSLFDQFNQIETDTERYDVEVCDTTTDPETGESEEDCDTESRTRLIVKIYSYDMEDVFGKIGFNEEQMEWARRLVTSGTIQEQFPDLAGGYSGGGGEPSSLTPEEMADLIENLGGDINKARKEVIETALTLEGKVEYFWGGKSPAGWNPNWGELVKVTAAGNDTTGTLQPYGLDCSGFIDWVFKTAGLGNVFSSGGTSYQWSKTFTITDDELIPGDLVFKNIPGQGGVNHIGIFIGRDQNGNNLYIHCTGGTGVTINSYKGFKYPRRFLLFR